VNNMNPLRGYGRYNPWKQYPRIGDRVTVLLLEWSGDHWFASSCWSMHWSKATAVGALWQSGLSIEELVDSDMLQVAESEALALVGW